MRRYKSNTKNLALAPITLEKILRIREKSWAWFIAHENDTTWRMFKKLRDKLNGHPAWKTPYGKELKRQLIQAQLERLM